MLAYATPGAMPDPPPQQTRILRLEPQELPSSDASVRLPANPAPGQTVIVVPCGEPFNIDELVHGERGRHRVLGTVKTGTLTLSGLSSGDTAGPLKEYGRIEQQVSYNALASASAVSSRTAQTWRGQHSTSARQSHGLDTELWLDADRLGTKLAIS